MKKIAALLLALTMTFGLVACGNNNTTVNTSLEQDTAESISETETGKVLVVYFSGSGNTARVAEDIADAAGADLFEITPAQPYTDKDLDYTNNNSRVVKEHDDESFRNVELTTTEVPDWDSYDTVFLGYPIWWQIAAWPVNIFVENNDFTGKTVIPFATSASSGMGESATLLEELAGAGDWQEGQRFPSSAATEDVQTWVNLLNTNI
nr:flavodoxin [uncultured Lachnoclostridium sp.]